MNGNDEQYAAKIREYLDHGATGLKAGTAYRLQQARAAALARLAGEAQAESGGTFVGAPTLAGAGGGMVGGGPRFGRPLLSQARFWIGVLLVVAAALGWQQWTAWQEIEDIEDLDAQILTSDLPIDALVDRGFQQWLRTPPSE